MEYQGPGSACSNTVINAWKKSSCSKWKHIVCEKLIKHFAWKNYLGQSTGRNCLESNYVEVNYPGVIARDQFFWGSLFGGQLSWGAIVRGAIVLGPPIIFIKTHRKIPVLGSLY